MPLLKNIELENTGSTHQINLLQYADNTCLLAILEIVEQ